MSRIYENSPDVLRGGDWVLEGGIKVWRKRQVVAQCGTRSGYNRHRRLEERACYECHLAEATYQREWKRAKRGSQPAAELQPHGTHAAYMRHRKAGHAPCDACLQAERAYQREAKRRRRAEMKAEREAA